MDWKLVKEDGNPEPEKTVFVLSDLYGYQVDQIQRISPNMPYRFNVPGVKYWTYPEDPSTCDMSELHQLIQDNEGHWYVVPVAYLDIFREMMEIEWDKRDEITKARYEALDEWRVEGPHEISFLWPIEDPSTTKQSD